MASEHDNFGDDVPKKNPWREDRLGVAPFAERISKVIQMRRAPNGYVIGLHGAWGSGKSTILNFVSAYLAKFNETADAFDKITTIDFRPWIVPNHQDLIGTFFKLLAESLGPRERWWKRRWKLLIRIFGYGSDKLIDAAATLAVAAVPPYGIASGAIGAVTKRSLNRMIDRFLQEPSLQVAYQQLVDQLKGSGRRFLVVVDDLDRLEEREIKEVMRMVKTIGHLPNVVYLLAYDKEIVWRALDDNQDRNGPKFAEKIVQQELELPTPSRAALLSILSERTSFIPPAPDDSMRWFYFVQYGIQRWVKSPRDVERLSNAVGFAWAALQGEVDPHDLLVLEGLKLFDTAAFTWIRDNRDFLFSVGVYQLAQDAEKQEAVARLNEQLQESSRGQVLRIVTALFPQVGRSMGDRYRYSDESHVELRKRRGVGSEAGYDSYFSLNPSRNSIPKSGIDRTIAGIDDADSIERAIRLHLGKTNDQGEPMVGEVLDELRLRFMGRDPIAPTQAMLDALFRVGDDVVVLDWIGREFVLAPRVKIWFFIQTLLELWGPEAAGERLREAFLNSDSTSFRADVYVSCGRAIGIFESDSRYLALVSKEGFDALGQQLLPAILREAQEGTLERAPYYFDIVRAWVHLGKLDDVRAWISSGMIRSPDFMAKVGKGLLSHTLGGRVRHYHMQEAPDPMIYDLEEIRDAGRIHLADSALIEDTRQMIAELVSGAEQFLSRPSDAGSTPTAASPDQ